MFENEKFDEILAVLRNGGIILYPTDTTWGIGCDATSEDAVQQLIHVKTEKPEKGYVLLVDSIEMLKKHVGNVHPRVQTLLAYHVRPLTIVYDEAIGIAQNAHSADGSVAVRIVQDAFCRELIRQFGKPIVKTSANIKGQKYPTHYGEIKSDILEKVDIVVRLRQDSKERGEPSIIARFNPGADELDFLRE
ncbi:MAG: L-threonylcarbamoyladenylate synthase [Saprospiraceae bacterium]|nr:L-threonylcarbamoyladenylate synthase [Saprospiraceae bacterium]